jgi:hypothetical protein
MEILIRLLLFLAIVLLTAKAEEQLLLNAHIRMIPKIMFLDTQVSSHNTGDKAILGVIYDANRKSSAKKIAEDINIYHSGKIGSFPFIATAISVDELLTRNDIAFAYLIEMNDSSVKRVASWGITQSVPTFSYDPNALDLGILGSISIERTTVIYLNKHVLKSAKFRFHSSLFQIAKLVE